MLLTPFSFIWLFQILIWYSKFLRNAYLCILLFSIEYFWDVKTFHDLDLSYFQFRFQGCLFSLKIEDTILNPGLTLIKQSNNGINITWMTTNLNNRYSVALQHKISLISPSLWLGSHFGQTWCYHLIKTSQLTVFFLPLRTKTGQRMVQTPQ